MNVRQNAKVKRRKRSAVKQRCLQKNNSLRTNNDTAGCTPFSNLLFTFAFSLFTFFAGCDESFQPISDIPAHPFTIYGQLDASRDTNWVRITPVRDSLYLSRNATTDAEVTLENLETGETGHLNKTLHEILTNVYVFNWWTTMKLEPGQTYQLVAKKPDGRSSSATVTLPGEFPDPVIRGDFNEMSFYFEGIPNLADFQVWYDVRHDIDITMREFDFMHLQDTVRWAMPSAHHEVIFRPGSHLEHIAGDYFPFPYTILRRKYYVASAGPEWVHFPFYDEKILELPDGVTNVEGGAGYLIGIVSKTMDF